MSKNNECEPKVDDDDRERVKGYGEEKVKVLLCFAGKQKQEANMLMSHCIEKRELETNGWIESLQIVI